MDLTIKYFDNNLIEGFQAYSTQYSFYKYPRHFHEHYTIVLVLHGVNKGFTEEGEYNLNPGGVLIINPGELHAGESINNGSIRLESFRLEPELLNRYIEHNNLVIKDNPELYSGEIYDPQLFNSGLTLANSLKTSEHSYSEPFEDFVSRILTKYMRHNSPKFSNDTLQNLIWAKEFIHDNFDQNIDIKAISENACLSSFHLIRSFKKSFGLTPMQYLRNLRVERVKALISKQKIAESAHEVGFFDHSHLIKSFKKIEGIPPSRIRY